MNIRTLSFRTRGSEEKSSQWNFKPGIGRHRNLIALDCPPSESSLFLEAFAYLFQGTRQNLLSEASADFIDNNGDVWLVERNAIGLKIRRNQKLLSLDEASQSLISSLLDMEASISNGIGLEASFISKKVLFSGKTPLSFSIFPDDGLLRIQRHCEEASRSIERTIHSLLPDFNSNLDTGKIYEALKSLRLKFIELDALSTSIKTVSPSPGLVYLETLSREMDLLTQIDFFAKKMGDGTDLIAKLDQAIQEVNQQVSHFSDSFPPGILILAESLPEWRNGLNLLLRFTGYGSFFEVLARAQKLNQTKIQPQLKQAFEEWSNLFSHSIEEGQGLESCLASLLLGLKQLSVNLDKIQARSPHMTPGTEPHQASPNWFDKIKDTLQKTVANDAGEVHRERVQAVWLGRCVQDLDLAKNQVSACLKITHDLSNMIQTDWLQTQSGSNSIEQLFNKAREEFQKLQTEWHSWANRHEIDISIELDSFMDIPAIGFEKVRFENELTSLSSRRAQRIEIESTLEKLIHQWWEATGSDRSGPLATPSILMAEARAVLRNKDTRRQKIQKLIKDIGSKSKDEQISFYYSKKKQELIQNLKSVSDELKATKPLDVEAVSLLINLLDELSMISKMNQDLVLNEASKGDIWSSNTTSMIRVFQLLETSESTIEAERQVTQLVKDCPFEGDTSVTFFLTDNSHLTETLYGQGLGRAFLSDRVERGYEIGSTGLSIESPNIQLLPKVQGASKVPLSENSRLLFEKNLPLEAKITPRASNQFADQVKKPKVTGAQPEDSMSARARAVLDLLNPKSKDKIR